MFIAVCHASQCGITPGLSILVNNTEAGGIPIDSFLDTILINSAELVVGYSIKVSPYIALGIVPMNGRNSSGLNDTFIFLNIL
jgi:hypothetical protein